MDPNSERATVLIFTPILTTLGFYFLPLHWQSNILIQLIPQLMAYLTFALWAFYNRNLVAKLGLELCKLRFGLKWGTGTGICLGCFNAFVIIYLVPAIGEDITFLRGTPHAQVPFWIMVPWFIPCIAFFVELNFRGFLLGRLLVFCSQTMNQHKLPSPGVLKLGILLPLILSALTFSFDPFMVATFEHLHWIAVWDGLIWGWLWIQKTNLYLLITAHAVEVFILYLTVRAALF